MEKAQLKAARALLGWSQEDLAAATGLSVQTIKRVEGGSGSISAAKETVIAIEQALESKGIELIYEEGASMGGGIGVRLNELDHESLVQSLIDGATIASETVRSLARRDFDEDRRRRFAEVAEELDDLTLSLTEEGTRRPSLEQLGTDEDDLS